MRVSVQYRQVSKENWKRFIQETGIDIPYLTYQNIIYTFNYNLRDYILETGDKGKAPWGIGDFAICKYKKKKTKTLPNGKEITNLSIDWKRTREAGKYIYHLNHSTEGYNFRWKWFIKSARFRHSDVWMFKPSRVSSRLLRHYLSQPEGYQYKYQQWSLIKQ